MRPLAAILWLYAATVSAQTGTGVVWGIGRADGAPAAGAEVHIESDALVGGILATVTGDDGGYRFPALPPGTYVLTVTRTGSRPASARLVLRAGESLRLDAALQPGASAEPAAMAPARSHGPAVIVTDLAAPLLETIPLEGRTGPGAMRLAPGVAGDFSAYGDLGPAADLYAVDALNGGDPERGAPWLQPAQGWLESVQILGPGSPASIGGHTGVAMLSLLRSGGDRFHGFAEFLYRNRALTASNASGSMLAAAPALALPSALSMSDTSIQAGGPLRAGRAWFFAGGHLRRSRVTPAGYGQGLPEAPAGGGAAPASPAVTSPRLLIKPTWRTSSKNTWSGFLLADRYQEEAGGASATVAPAATVRERATTLGWSARFTRVVSDATVIEASYAGFRGTGNRTPYNGETPGWYDVSTGFYSVNAPYRSGFLRARQQGHAALRRFASGPGGAHDLALGVEAEAAGARSDLAFPGNRSIDAGGGRPVFLYTWEGARRDNSLGRAALYAQDAWAPAVRLRLDAGLRAERTTAANRHGGGRLYASTSLVPRVGLAWQLREGGRSLVRGHYGWYDGDADTARIDAADPDIAPVLGVPLSRQGGAIGAPAILAPGTHHRVDAGLKPPRVRAAVVGLEHHAGPLATGVYAIDRRTDRVVDDALTYRAVDYVRTLARDVGPDGFAASGDETTATVDVYAQLTDPARNILVVSNPRGAFRTYQGLAVTAALPLGGRGDLQGSWVLSKTIGNYDGDGAGGSADYDGPNTDPALQPFRTGRVAADRTHVAKLFGAYRLPLRLTGAAAFYYETGGTFTRVQSVRLNERRVDVFVEPRGSHRLDSLMQLDVRLAREFRAGGGRRVGIAAEAFNALNRAAVTARVTRSGLRYAEPLEITPGRRIRLGTTFRF